MSSRIDSKSKRNLFIVGSLFNLLLVLQLKRSLFPDEEGDIIIFDGSNGLREISQKSELRKYFKNIYFSETKRNIRINKILSILSPDRAFCNLVGLDRLPLYTDIYFWNPEETFYYLIMGYEKRKHPYRLHVYSDALSGWFLRTPDEDMPAGYVMYGRLNDIIEKYMTRRYGFKQVKDCDFDYYMFSPEKSLADHKHKTVAIPLIDTEDEDFVESVNRIFSFSNEYRISQKYIFMDGASNRWADKRTHDAVINAFAQVVGYDNFIVKPHPRTDKEYYKDCYAQIEEKVYPWDLYCLNHDISDKTLIICDGASAFVPELLYGHNPKLISVRKCIGEIKGGYPDNVWGHLCGLIAEGVLELESCNEVSIRMSLGEFSGI